MLLFFLNFSKQEPPSQYTMHFEMTLFWIFTIIFLAVSIFFILFIIFFNQKVLQKNKAIKSLEEKRKVELLQNTIEIQEKERARLGADIHDDLGPMLSTIKMHVNQVNHTGEVNGKMQLISNYLDDTISDMREISKNLFPTILKEFGLQIALEDLKDRVNSTNEIEVHFDYNSDFKSLKESVALSLYRISQEFINNSLKHSQAKNIYITLDKRKNQTALDILDDGIGFDLTQISKNKKGIGLKNMELRSRSINAAFKLHSEPNKGTQITVLYTPQMELAK